MYKLATQVFMGASIAFGAIGILFVLTSSGPDTPDSDLTNLLGKLLMITVFVILPSFALSVAGRFLDGKK